jgi:hypothetical protein
VNTIYFDTHETRPEWFSFYNVTWQSLLPHLKDEMVVVVSQDASPEMLKQVPSRFEIIEDKTVYNSLWLGFSVHLRRWRNSNGDPNDKIIFSDARDVLFQRNPFDDIPDHSLIVQGEGSVMKDDPWNTGDQNNVQNSLPHEIRVHPDKVANWNPVCAGYFGGQRQRVKDLMLMLWLTSSPMASGTDQGALNYIFHNYLSNEPLAIRCDPHTNDWVMGGHHFRILNPPCRWENQKLICGATGRPYAAVHQWDRTAWRDEILKMFN